MIPSVLMLDVAGNPRRWITYEDAAYYHVKGLVAWTPSDSEILLRGGVNSTGDRSTLNINTIIAVKGDVNAAQLMRPPRLTNRILFRRDRNLCAYCGHQFAHENLTRDHIIPTSRGGQDIWSNVVTACSGCNRVKDCRTPEEARMPLRYVPYIPSRAEYLILSNRRILGDQMDFLMSRVSNNSRLHEEGLNEYM